MPCRALLPCLETSETLAAQSRAPPLLPAETLVAQSWAPPTPALGLRASSRGETQPWCLHSLCPVTEQGGCETTGHWSLIKCYLGTEERLLSSRDRGEFQSGSICYYRLVTEYQSVRDLPSHNLGVLISEIKVFPGCFLLRPLSLLIGNSLLNLFAHGLPFCVYLCPNLLLL